MVYASQEMVYMHDFMRMYIMYTHHLGLWCRLHSVYILLTSIVLQMGSMAAMVLWGWRVSLDHEAGRDTLETVAPQAGEDSLGARGPRASQDWTGEMDRTGGMEAMGYQGKWYVLL